MNKKIREAIGATLYHTIGLKNAIKLYYFMKFKKFPDLKNPKRFTEKIQLRKVNYDKKIYSKLADKYEVRKHIAKEIGEEILIPLYFAKPTITVEDLEKLPNSFVLKTNNASGTNIIVRDKSKEDLSKIVKTMNEYVKTKFWYRTFEMFYKNIKPLIIAEKYLETSDGFVPNDYKFHVFKKKDSQQIMIQADHGRYSEKHDRAYFDEDWNIIDMNNGEKFETDFVFEKPKNYKKMLEIVKKLSKKFDYVRVDLYNDNGKIYFGEITFTDGSGLDPYEPDEMDFIIGDYWDYETK